MTSLAALRSGQLAGATRLDLRADLTELPDELQALAATLEILDISGNRLHELPEWLGQFSRLRIIFASGNRFTELPRVLGRLPALEQIGFRANQLTAVPAESLPPTLRWLILTGNALTALPEALGDCQHLRKCALAGNRLSVLPERMQQCRDLELLRISANALREIPDWLSSLPRLSWLAYAANAGAPPLPVADLPPMSWSGLQVGGIVGDGASGVVHGALSPAGAALAVKVFKGELTSDGLPESELAAAVAAGSHPHLIGAEAVLTGHPSGAAGLVMPLLAGGWRRLAGPPSLESCTRDIYPLDMGFSLAQAQAIARGIAGAVTHLHARGLLHGDVYAHNILWDGRGHACLGDFGAASALPAGVAGEQLARLEVRALGCLLEELLTRVRADEVPDWMWELRWSCMDPNTEARPSAAELVTALG